MKHIRGFSIGFLTFIALGFSADAQQNVAQQAYAIFQQNCLRCHGEHGPYTEAIVIESAEGLVQSGAVVPGKPIESELYTRLLEKDPAKRMPWGQDPLPATAILTIEKLDSGRRAELGSPPRCLLHHQRYYAHCYSETSQDVGCL